MDIKIPSKYRIGGQEVNIKFVDSIKDSQDLGQLTLAAGEILIAENFNGFKQSKSSEENTFIHELVHSILETMGELELSHNEKFVCCFASFLTEAIRTMEE